MLTITELDQYTVDFIDRRYQSIDRNVSDKGYKEALDYDFKTLDCTRILNNGQRAIQTIDYTYAARITEVLYIIDKYADDSEKQTFIDKLLEIHKNNLKFEETTPPEIYDKKKGLKPFKTKDNTNKEKKERKSREKGPSAAQRKLAAKVAKLNSLSINLPIKKV